MTLIATAKKILHKPTDFFNTDVHKVTTWKEPIVYLIAFTFFSTIFLTFHYLGSLQSVTLWLHQQIGIQNTIPSLEPTLSNYVLIYFLSTVLLIAIAFFKYWITHWYVYLWNKKAQYKTTYKALSYSTTPGWLAIPFFVIASYLFFFATTKGGFIYWTLGIIVGLVFLSLELYAMYIRSYALAKLQDLSMLQSFLIIYLFGWITYLILIFILEAILIIIYLSILSLFA